MGQIITKFFIEPLHEQSKLIGEIAYSLIFYANFYSNPGIGNFEKIEEASKVLRQQASQLLENSYAIKLSWLWELLGVIPKQQNIIAASKILIALSNFVLSSKVDTKISVDWANQIKNALYIRID